MKPNTQGTYNIRKTPISDVLLNTSKLQPSAKFQRYQLLQGQRWLRVNAFGGLDLEVISMCSHPVMSTQSPIESVWLGVQTDGEHKG